jgi:uncharacterized protein (DUF111 family)
LEIAGRLKWESFLDIHLDPLGGLSGDMFVAALLDAFPEHWPHVQTAITCLNLGDEAQCRLAPHHDHSFAGRRFLVGADWAGQEPQTGRRQAERHGDLPAITSTLASVITAAATENGLTFAPRLMDQPLTPM